MTTPVWGCPWHGPVRGGLLILPNATTREWPQPDAHYDLIGGVLTAIPDTWGATHRLAVPGVPAVVRNEEELAADEEAGRQWRSTAILSGDRQDLWGRSLDGWVYIDSDGARWLVRCTNLDENTVRSFAAPWSASLTLSRFGEVGGEAESYSYPVGSGWGIDGDLAPTSGRLRLESIRPDGSAAILMVHERRVNAAETQIRWPYAFLELSLSGPGAAAAVGCSVVKARSAVSQATVAFNLGPTYMAGYYYGPPSFTPEWRFQLASTPPGPGEGNFSEWGGRSCKVYSGAVSLDIRRTLSIWYDASGNRRDVDFVIDWNGSADIPAPTQDGLACSGSAGWTASIEVGGAVRCQLSGAWEGAASETLDGISPGSMNWTRTVTTDGVDYPESVSGAADNLSWVALPFDEILMYAAPTAAQVEANATTFNGHLAVIRYAPQVIGLYADRPSARAYHPPATPSGTASGSVVTGGIGQRYGAWDPYSGATAWLETSPVCWV